MTEYDTHQDIAEQLEVIHDQVLAASAFLEDIGDPQAGLCMDLAAECVYRAIEVLSHDQSH
jgi:hypothetical protein